MKLIIKASYGNDSVAMIAYIATCFPHVRATVIYSDTGWSSDEWSDRVVRGEAFARSCGYETVRAHSEGFVALVKRKMGFPRQGIQFCTEELKINPSKSVMDQIDPTRTAVVAVGKRREESANRKDTPVFVPQSAPDNGRLLWHPIVMMTEAVRNKWIERAGFDVLPHRSMECFPCINSNRADIRLLATNEKRMQQVEALEKEMGHTKAGKPRTFFRPYRYMGATGIREIARWGLSERGEFDLDDGAGDTGACYSGQCGH